MKKIFLFIIVSFMFLIPIDGFALTDDYIDVVYEKAGIKKEEDIVNIYLFYGDGCPHCSKEIGIFYLK